MDIMDIVTVIGVRVTTHKRPSGRMSPWERDEESKVRSRDYFRFLREGERGGWMSMGLIVILRCFLFVAFTT